MKKVLRAGETRKAPPAYPWFDLEKVERIEISSERSSHPIENAVRLDAPGDWIASVPGEQVIRLYFDPPLSIHRIHVVIEETHYSRTQEMVFRWASDLDGPLRDILRQQWNFSAPGSTREVEDYEVQLSNVRVLELAITPDIGGGPAVACLRELRIG